MFAKNNNVCNVNTKQKIIHTYSHILNQFMKVKSFHAHIAYPHSHRKEVFRGTSNQSMKVKSFLAHIVNTKQVRKMTYRHT